MVPVLHALPLASTKAMFVARTVNMFGFFPHLFLVITCAVSVSSFHVPALFTVPKRPAPNHGRGGLHLLFSASDADAMLTCIADGSKSTRDSTMHGINSRTRSNKAALASRRDALRQLLVAGSAVVSATTALEITRPAQAACLPGDKNVDCIGVYKVPVDDRVLPYVKSPEMLETFAPDVRWVPPVEYPTTYVDAFTKLADSRDRFEKIVIDSIKRGKLEDAGVELLDITPLVTVAGRVIVSELSGSPRKSNDWTSSSISEEGGNRGSGDLSMKGLRAEVVLSELVVALGQVDILLGQGMNGQLGSITAAQIQLLSACTEINDLFRDLFNILPKKM